VQRAPGVPCALCLEGQGSFWQTSGVSRRENAYLCLDVIARSEATKQSILSLRRHGLLRFARNNGFD
jgi:hypothetical protein